jgi:hypothetical protein
MLRLPLGLHGEIGAVVVAVQRPDLPLATERLLLTVAANQAVIGLQEAANKFSRRIQLSQGLRASDGRDWRRSRKATEDARGV